MAKEDDLQRVIGTGMVAIIRSPSGEQLVQVARALHEGGIDVIEVTFTVPGVLEIISQVKRELGKNILLGAGTVLDPETARMALLAGAEFIVAPNTNTDVIKLCQRYGKLVMPGAFTPTEIVTAWEAGADIIKIFPADSVGPGYLKAIHGPLPQVRLLPTGGVDLTTIASFLQAGACAVGLGSALVEKKALEEKNWDRVRELARQYVEIVKKTRNQT